MLSFLKEVYPIFGWLGCLIILAGVLVSALVYRGKDGERYSLKNHFISELGEVGVSRLAFVFNLAMTIGGILFILMMAGLGTMLSSIWGKVAVAAGILAGTACALVGVFPMNHIKPHAFVAMTYFRSGMLTTLLFTIAIFVQPVAAREIPLSVNIFGILALSSYVLFLVAADRASLRKRANENVLDTEQVKEHPKFWVLPFLEWIVFFTTLLWFMAVAALG